MNDDDFFERQERRLYEQGLGPPPKKRRGPYRRPRFDRMADDLQQRRAVFVKEGRQNAVDLVDALIPMLRHFAAGAGTRGQLAEIIAAQKVLNALQN